ncbi:MAG: hypothetical protein R3B54_05620 [Bdellovibrionota bacterium]
MKFTFRLKSFLKLMELREQKKKMELGQSQQRVREMETSIAETRESLKNSLAGSSYNKRDLNLWMAFGAQAVLGQLEQLNEVESALRDEEDRREMFRGELAEVSAKRKGLENLRENLHKKFRVARDKKEQKEIEDITRVLKRFVR